jgi:hypothetical protein
VATNDRLRLASDGLRQKCEDLQQAGQELEQDIIQVTQASLPAPETSAVS